RQRRLHLRLPDWLRHQRLATAIHRARQQHRRLVQRRLESSLLRRRGCTPAVVRQHSIQPAPLHDPADQSHHPPAATPPPPPLGPHSSFPPLPHPPPPPAPPGLQAPPQARRSRSATSSSPNRQTPPTASMPSWTSTRT